SVLLLEERHCCEMGKCMPIQHTAGLQLLSPGLPRHVHISDRTSKSPGELFGNAVHILGPRARQLVDLANVPGWRFENRGHHPRDVFARDRRGLAISEGEPDLPMLADRMRRQPE